MGKTYTNFYSVKYKALGKERERWFDNLIDAMEFCRIDNTGATPIRHGVYREDKIAEYKKLCIKK